MKVPESNRNIHYILDGNPDRIESLLEDAEEQWKPYYEEDERLALFAARLASLDKSLNHLAFRDTTQVALSALSFLTLKNALWAKQAKARQRIIICLLLACLAVSICLVALCAKIAGVA